MLVSSSFSASGRMCLMTVAFPELVDLCFTVLQSTVISAAVFLWLFVMFPFKLFFLWCRLASFTLIWCLVYRNCGVPGYIPIYFLQYMRHRRTKPTIRSVVPAKTDQPVHSP